MKEKVFEAISIVQQNCPLAQLKTFANKKFNFIFVLSGSGVFTKYQTPNSFSKGDLFFVPPFEDFSMETLEDTTYYHLTFTDLFRLELRELVLSSKGKGVSLAKARSPLNRKISFDKKDEILITRLFDYLTLLYDEPNKNEDLFYYPVLNLVSIIERNTPNPHTQKNTRLKKNINNIVTHIHKNIRHPEMLKVNYMAHKFNLSTNQLTRFFKKEMNTELKKYTNQCRMQLIVEKVQREDITFSEIAHEFGFTDESYFTKVFKKQYNQSPTEYRKAFLERK